MINNLTNIIPFLIFDSKDDFYHLQILKRKKENKDLGSNSVIIKTYYISSVDYLLLKMEEIIMLCDINNARACINLNRRSFEKVAYQVLRKVADQILNKDFKSVRKAYESTCGAHSNEPIKRWIIDIDVKNSLFTQSVIESISKCEPIKNSSKVLICLDTKHGVHLITNPFNVQEFKQYHPDLDIHKDNPTILYIS